eukprot:CAMPEP_0183707896 /NCGR_PEP_ID=MMETSP0737-20130205/4316_1 /TAXON_ID=385413 /ORGANISM="Thalassiosira miniscula, Strain CCMP1093" /LENGTH=378 /DNA_ID=CAMNT_0025935635 /DNA_START=9 /DNA_END=1145 /DNA_ORIENTATION=-
MASNDDGDGRSNIGGGNNDVQYFDSDFSFEEHAAECTAEWERSGAEIPTSDVASDDESDDDLLPQSQSKVWDAFHSNHSAGNFYKPRRYLTKSFPCILQYFQHDNTLDGGDDGDAEPLTKEEDKILLEIGCGSGSSCIPIIKQCSEMEERSVGNATKSNHVLLACDSSPVAVETTRRFIEKMMEKEYILKPCNFSFGTFVADPSLCEEESNFSFQREVKSAYEHIITTNAEEHSVPKGCDRDGDDSHPDEGGIVGIVLMVFVLSAVTPSRVNRFLEQVYQTTKHGGRVCFRDYGLYDMPMLRFPPSSRKSTAPNDPVFVRGEGTIARFFSVESTKELFESAGFTTVELRYCTVFNHNRKTGQKLKRVFVHGVFEKPAS